MEHFIWVIQTNENLDEKSLFPSVIMLHAEHIKFKEL